MTNADRTLGGALLAAVVLAGCAGSGAGSSDDYDCMGTPISAETLTDPRPATELDATGRAALAGTDVPPIDPAEWTIVSTDPREVVLLRELAEPDDHGAGDVRTHEHMVVTLVDAPSTPAWRLSALGTCAITSTAPGAGSATVTLDPDAPPSPGSTTVALLVTEMECNSGEDADGRVELATLRETDTAVDVVLTIEPRDGPHDCQSNPPTPFTIELDEPLGDRRLLDASTLPPRPVALPTT